MDRIYELFTREGELVSGGEELRLTQKPARLPHRGRGQVLDLDRERLRLERRAAFQAMAQAGPATAPAPRQRRDHGGIAGDWLALAGNMGAILGAILCAFGALRLV